MFFAGRGTVTTGGFIALAEKVSGQQLDRLLDDVGGAASHR